QLMETSSSMLGPEYPDTLSGMAIPASTYRNQGWWKETEELDVHVMERGNRILRVKHPDTLTSMRNLTCTLKSQRCIKKAISLLEKCSQLRKQALCPLNPPIEISLEALEEWQMEIIMIGL
ncbi:kinesin light chain, partial [Phaeosphaeriaceae sp. PMI808]